MDRPDRTALRAVLVGVLLVFVAVATGQAASLGERPLKVGSRGADVRSLQIKLKRLDFFRGRVDVASAGAPKWP